MGWLAAVVVAVILGAFLLFRVGRALFLQVSEAMDEIARYTEGE